MKKHPINNFSWYGLKKRLSGRRAYNVAERSGLVPVLFPDATLRIFSTPVCNAGCSYCTNLQFPDWKEQFKYDHLPAKDMAKGLNRFYGHYQYYFSGGECALRDDFPELIDSMDRANIVVMTNLSNVSVANLKRIKKNNVLLDISYHPHMMELLAFVDNYKALPQFEKKVHIVQFRDTSTAVLVASLAKYGIKAQITHGVINTKYQKVRTKSVKCRCLNFHVDPEGGIHTCRARTIMKRQEMGNILDPDLDESVFGFTDCDDYGVCGDCDVIREVYARE